jgi:hypothetical protein
MTIMLRKDPFDILAVVRQLISAGPDELSTFHPVITLVQTVVDITDPINYAPYFTSGRLRGGSPTHLLVTEGDQDQATPPVTTEAMAAAAGLPVLSPSVHLDTGLVLSGAPVVDLPVSGNVASESGQPATALLAQFAGWDHFVVFDHEPAAQLYARLVESASYGPVGVLDLP